MPDPMKLLAAIAAIEMLPHAAETASRIGKALFVQGSAILSVKINLDDDAGEVGLEIGYTDLDLAAQSELFKSFATSAGEAIKDHPELEDRGIRPVIEFGKNRARLTTVREAG